jgi:hypothetical protein
MEETIYYGNYNEEGTYVGFYLKEIHGDRIPSQVIPLTKAQWQQALEGHCKVVNGQHTYIEPIPPTQEEIDNRMLQVVRDERNYLLSLCDWTQLNDCQLSESKKNEWSIYRQKLRDFPSVVDLNNIVYPESPF